ncbi:MAG TPA: M28 family peptidase, partial [Polyangia bacterium]
IPAVTIGNDDAHALRAALDANQPVRARLAVDIGVARAVGRNIVGRVRGLSDGEIVVGAHFDTWFAGSTDNGGGVAALLALAERRALRGPMRYGITFVAWDGEELALYGGYHQLRRYALEGTRPLAVIDFETPSAIGAQAYGLARSNHATIEEAIIGVDLHELFALNVPMDLVAELFGGVIPTDIQGLYRSGAPAVATAVDAPWYHTVEDTPDKVDLPRLETTVNAFDRMIDRLMSAPPDRFAARDAALWQATVTLGRRDGDLVVDVTVTDAQGRAQPAAFVEAVLFEDDFFARATLLGRTNGDGIVCLHFLGLAAADTRRFIHIAAGQRWPLVEVVVPL